MKSLFQELYRYVQEERLYRTLVQAGPEARQLSRQAAREEELLEERLEGEERELFSRYLDHRAQADLQRELALLRCGVSIGLELAGL